MPLVRLLALLVALGVLFTPAVASASDDPAELAAAVENEIVHVDPRVKGRVSAAEAGRLRLRIAGRATGRIKILVVPPSASEKNGGINGLTNAVRDGFELRGALIVVAGTEVLVATSYDNGPAVAAVQQAMAGPYRKRIADDLLAAVDGVARVDPGPQADAGAGGTALPLGTEDDPIGFKDFLGDVGHTIRIVVFGIGGVFVLLLLTPLVVYGLRARRRRAEGAEDLEVARAAARDQLIAVGETLRELDLDAEMPGADPAGREALGRAIELYGRADRALAKANTRRRLDRARATLFEARDQAELARGRLTTLPAPTGSASD